MNDGKSFAFFDWTFKHALVPPAPYPNATSNQTIIYDREPEEEIPWDWEPSQSQEKRHWNEEGNDNGNEKRHWNKDGNENDQARPHGWAAINAFGRRPPAPHDPLSIHGKPFSDKSEWVRPDFIVKTDDDSFMMLAELEARLRVLPRRGVYWGCTSYFLHPFLLLDDC